MRFAVLGSRSSAETYRYNPRGLAPVGFIEELLHVFYTYIIMDYLVNATTTKATTPARAIIRPIIFAVCIQLRS